MIDTETRWQQVRWLLHDDSLKPEDRLAGLLVLLYAQRTTVISRLTLSHIQPADWHVLIQFGREPIVLPVPVDALPLMATPPLPTTEPLPGCSPADGPASPSARPGSASD